MTSPSARNAATASRTTVRLTPVAAIISCSVGKRDPGGILPLVMSSVSRTTNSPVKDRGADSGRVTERFVVHLLITLTPSGGQSSYDMTSAYHAPTDRSRNPAPPRAQETNDQGERP